MSEINKIALILPGRREQADSKAYKQIGTLFEEQSIKAVYIQPEWKLKSISEQLRDTSIKVNQSIGANDEVYFLGFSKGALFALICASQIRVKKSILCSMSFFKEEIPHMGMLLKLFTRKMVYGGEEPFSYPQIRQKNDFCFIYGEKELKSIPDKIMASRAELFNSGETIIAKKAGHNISHRGYQSALKSIIKGL